MFFFFYYCKEFYSNQRKMFNPTAFRFDKLFIIELCYVSLLLIEKLKIWFKLIDVNGSYWGLCI